MSKKNRSEKASRVVKLSDGSSIEIPETGGFNPHDGYSGVVQSVIQTLSSPDGEPMVIMERCFKTTGKTFSQLTDGRQSGLLGFLSSDEGWQALKTAQSYDMFSMEYLACVGVAQSIGASGAKAFLDLAAPNRDFFLSVARFVNGEPVEQALTGGTKAFPDYNPEEFALHKPHDGAYILHNGARVSLSTLLSIAIA